MLILWVVSCIAMGKSLFLWLVQSSFFRHPIYWFVNIVSFVRFVNSTLTISKLENKDEIKMEPSYRGMVFTVEPKQSYEA
jgi:hypothetical protein